MSERIDLYSRGGGSPGAGRDGPDGSKGTFRRRKYVDAAAPQRHHSAASEFVWTIFAIMAGIVLAELLRPVTKAESQSAAIQLAARDFYDR